MARAISIVALVVVVLLIATIALLVVAPGALLRQSLRVAGVDAVAFDDLRLGLDRLEIDGLEIGAPPQQRLARLRVGYRIGELLSGRVETIEIDGLELTGRVTNTDVELLGFEGAGGTGGDFDAALPLPERIVLRSAIVNLGTQWGQLRLPFEAEMRPTSSEAAFTLDVAGAELIGEVGRLSGDLSVEGRTPLKWPLRVHEAEAQGHLDLIGERLEISQVASGIGGQVGLDIEAREGALSVQVSEVIVELASLAPQLHDLAALLPLPYLVQLPDGAGPLRVVGWMDGDQLSLDVDGSLAMIAVDGAAGGVETDLQAHLGMAEGITLRQLSGRGALTFADVQLPAITLREGRLDVQGGGVPGQWESTLDLDLAGDGAPTPGLWVAGVSLRQALGLSLDEDRLTVVARDAGELRIEGVGWDGGAAGPLQARLVPGDRPLATAVLTGDSIGRWHHSLAAQGESFDLRLDGSTPLHARVQPGSVLVELSGHGRSLGAGRAMVLEGRLRLPDLDLALDGIRTEVAFAAGGLAVDQAIPIAIAAVRHEGEPALLAPLALAATIHPGAERIGFEAHLSRAAGGIDLQVRGEHDPGRGRGRATLELKPVTFGPGERQLGDIAPILRAQLKEAVGRTALDGTVTWGADAEIRSDLALLIENLAFTAGPARVEQMNGVIEFDRLWPVTTRPDQELAVGLLDFGLPLGAGLVTFELQPGPKLVVSSSSWPFAGGTITVAEPFSMGSEASSIIMTLTAEGLDLGQLLALTRLDDLSGEGRLSGSLPVQISGAEAVIDGGELEAEGPGWLRYRPDTVPAALQAGGEGVSLLMQALESFRYEELWITLDGRTDAAMDIGLHLRGANPDLLGGYPIDFNLDLEGELANILRSGLATYQIPDRIREQMQGFDRR